MSNTLTEIAQQLKTARKVKKHLPVTTGTNAVGTRANFPKPEFV